MLNVNIHEAKTNLSKLIAAAEAGESVIISRAGKPAVRLTSVKKTIAKPSIKKTPEEPSLAPRTPGGLFGCMKGKIWMSDDFDAPLPDSFWLGEDDSK